MEKIKPLEIVSIKSADYGITEDKAKEISAQFKPMLDKITELEDEFNEVRSLDVTTAEASLKAKALRLKYVKVRTGVLAIHKTQKAFYLSGGRYVDGWKSAYLFATDGIEAELDAIEKHYENQEKAKAEKLHSERSLILEEFGVFGLAGLGLMDPEIWDNYLSGVKLNFEKKREEAKKAEADRIESERVAKEKQEADDKEAERLKAENQKLKEEADAKALKTAKLEADLKKQKAQADKLKKEKEDKEKAEIEAKEREEIARKAFEQKQRLAPDNDKIKAYIDKITNIEKPELITAEGALLLSQIDGLLIKISNFANEKIKSL